jgi:predicted Zn-dependent peptidase
MVVTGDVTAAEVFRLAEKYIEPIPARNLPSKITIREPEQIGERRITVRKYARLPILMLGYHVPESVDPDYYALEVLESLLFDGESSRLHQRLVDKDQLAISVSSDYGLSFDPGLFQITVRLKTGVSTDNVEKAIYEELDRLKSTLVTDRELEKAKNILLAAFYRRMKTISGKANALGNYQTFFGDYRRLFTAADDYGKVQKEDLQRIARQYFTENNRTVAILIPEAQESGR